MTCIKGRDGQVFGVSLGAVHSLSLGQNGTVQPVKGHGGNLVEFLLRFGDWTFLLLVVCHFGHSHQASITEPMEDRRAIFILHILHKVMCPTVGNTPVFMWVGEDDLASGVVTVQREKGFKFPVNPICQDYQMEGVIA